MIITERLHKSYEWREHSAAIYCICEGRQNATVFSAAGDRLVVEWNIKTKVQEPFAVKMEHPAYSVLFIPENEFLWIGSSVGNIHIIDTKQRIEFKNFTTHNHGIFDLRYDERNRLIYAAGGDGLLSVYSIDGAWIRTIPIAPGKIRQIAVHPKEKKIALACGDGSVRVFETDFLNEIETLQAHEDSATAVCWHPTKEVLLTGGKDARLKAWHQQELMLDIPAHHYAIYSIVPTVLNDQVIIATSSRDKTIKLWDGNDLSPLQRIDKDAHSHSVNRLLWITPEQLVSSSDDRRLILWDLD